MEIQIMKNINLTGCGTALITPFNEDKSINFDKLEELLEFHIANKTDCVLILGTTSESPTFTWEEDYEIVKRSHFFSKKELIGIECRWAFVYLGDHFITKKFIQ